MRGERIFLDTWFALALLNARDAFNVQAKRLIPRIRSATQVITTEAVLVEICSGWRSSTGSGQRRS